MVYASLLIVEKINNSKKKTLISFTYDLWHQILVFIFTRLIELLKNTTNKIY